MNREGSLTRRATLTFVSSLLQQIARFVIGFIVTPIVIRGLGHELYGAWTMIQQSAGYIALSDMRPAGTLKFTLAIRQHVEEIHEKQRQIGAAVYIWAMTFPILLALSALAVWLTPLFIRTSPSNVADVRWAMALVMTGIALDRILSLPSNVLRGMNMDYKAMGLNAALTLIGGALSVFAIKSGWGLPGVAAAGVTGVALVNLGRFVVAIRALPWLRMARPKREELVKFARLSGWLFFSSLSTLLLSSSDLLLIGLLVGPAAAAVYATTGAVLRMTVDPLTQLIRSGMPGLADLCGRGDWPRVMQVRTEMHSVTIGIMAVVGTGVVALNQSFLKLWVGENFYGGNATNLLLVLVALGIALFRIDSVIIDSMLEFRSKSIAQLVAGIFVILLGSLMLYLWGLPGMACGVMLGYFGLITYLQLLIRRCTGISAREYLKSLARPGFVAISLLCGAHVVPILLRPNSWPSFAGVAVLVALTAASCMWWGGLHNSERTLLARRFSSSFMVLRSVMNRS